MKVSFRGKTHTISTFGEPGAQISLIWGSAKVLLTRSRFFSKKSKYFFIVTRWESYGMKNMLKHGILLNGGKGVLKAEKVCQKLRKCAKSWFSHAHYKFFWSPIQYFWGLTVQMIWLKVQTFWTTAQIFWCEMPYLIPCPSICTEIISHFGEVAGIEYDFSKILDFWTTASVRHNNCHLVLKWKNVKNDRNGEFLGYIPLASFFDQARVRGHSNNTWHFCGKI